MTELTNEKLLELKAEGKTAGEIGKEFGMSPQKIGGLLKKAEFEKAIEENDDEIPPEVFAKSNKVIKDSSMGRSIVDDSIRISRVFRSKWSLSRSQRRTSDTARRDGVTNSYQ